MTQDYMNYLAHYGVPGQKWGERKWQNEDGTYTEAGKQHYGWGFGRRPGSGGINPGPTRPPAGAKVEYTRSRTPRERYNFRRNNVQQQNQRRELTEEEKQARKARTKRVIAIASGVALAAIAGYAAYKKSTKIRDTLREEASHVYREHGFYEGPASMLAADKYNRRKAVSEWLRTKRWR